MPKFNISVNGKKTTVDVDNDTPLLWVLRDTLKLTGTKYGCGEGYCGNCTVHIDGEAVRSCSTTINEANGKEITTIEGLAANHNHPLIKAWIDEQVPQCGYCQPGQIMTAAALFNNGAIPSENEIESVMSTVLCRCGTYFRIKNAIKKVVSNGGVK